jgi:hypothetical protein
MGRPSRNLSYKAIIKHLFVIRKLGIGLGCGVASDTISSLNVDCTSPGWFECT